MKKMVYTGLGVALILCGYFLVFGKDEKRQPATKSGSYLLFEPDQLYVAPDEAFISEISFDRSCKSEADWKEVSCITLNLVATTKGFLQSFEIPYPSGHQILAFWTSDSSICIVIPKVKTIHLIERNRFNDHHKDFQFIRRTVEISELTSQTREFVLLSGTWKPGDRGGN